MVNFVTEKLDLCKTSFQELTKLKQYLLFFGVSGAILIGASTALGLKLFRQASPSAEKSSTLKAKEKKIKIESSGARLNQQEVWVDRLEKERDLLKKRVEELEKVVLPLAQQHLAQQPIGGAASSLQNAVYPVSSSSPGASSQTLNPDFLSSGETSHQPSNPQASTLSSQDTLSRDKERASLQDKPKEKATYQRISFRLDPQFSKKIKRSIDHYVPAGSFVRGVLTSGVVASTSIQASANPQPVHIQLTDLGNLPRNFKADVKQCFIIGSAYGDLPSERVYMRLEKLSCIERKTQEVIEVTVDGYVAGEDGANGLRGSIVDRSGPAMRNAFIGGFFSGMGDFFGQQKSQVPTAITQSGVAVVNPLNAQHLVQAGVGKGIGNAMEKFSDFYIKRAEQLQPVVEIEPGRRVDVVFKAGFDMNQTVYRQTLMNTHDGERRDMAARSDDYNLQPLKGLPS